MNGKDDIKDLFQRELGNHQVKVDPQLWQGIQAQLGNAATGSAGGAITAAKTTVALKIGVTVVTLAAAVFGTYLIVTTFSTPEQLDAKPTPKLTAESTVKQEAELINESEQELGLTNGTAATNEEHESGIALQTEVEPSALEIIEIPEREVTPGLPIEGEPQEVTEGPVSPSETEALSTEAVVSPLEVAIEFTKLSNQHYVFQARSVDAEKVIWDFGDGLTYAGIESEHIFTESGTFEVVATAYRKGESVSSSVTITIEVAGKITLLPTFFTPNGDGSNDEFFIQSEGLLDFSIVILNESGGILFESNDANFTWDGRDRTSGMIAEPGVYFYIITAKDKLGNNISKHQRLQLKK